MSFNVRYPQIDFSKVPAHWAPNVAFSQERNATSLIPAPVEPWLIKLLQSVLDQPVLDQLPATDHKLRDEVMAFIRQESQHFKQHRLFNDAIIAQGYPRLAEFEKQLADELEAMRETRSLKFLFAYADGFESLGAVSGALWFGAIHELTDGADPNAVALWKWHMAEEFEHREVCFKVYKALFCRGLVNSIVNGYFYRLYGFIFALRHLGGFTRRALRYMLQTDKRTMTEADWQKVVADLEVMRKFMRKHFLPKLLLNFLPWYDPGRKRAPRGLAEYLRQFEPGGVYARSRGRTAAPAA